MLISVLTACTVIVLVQGVELQSIASVFWNSASIAGDGEFLQALLSHGEVRSMANTVCTTIFIFGIIGAFNTAGIIEALIAPVTKRASSPARLTAAAQMVAVVGNMLGTNTFSILMAGSFMANAGWIGTICPVTLPPHPRYCARSFPGMSPGFILPICWESAVYRRHHWRSVRF